MRSWTVLMKPSCMGPRTRQSNDVPATNMAPILICCMVCAPKLSKTRSFSFLLETGPTNQWQLEFGGLGKVEYDDFELSTLCT